MHHPQGKLPSSKATVPPSRNSGTDRVSGRALAAVQYDAAIHDTGRSSAYVAGRIGVDRKIVDRQRSAEKPIQAGDIYVMPPDVALRFVRAILHELEMRQPSSVSPEALALRCAGKAAGLASRIAGMLADQHIDQAEGLELRAMSRTLVNDLMSLCREVTDD